MKVKENLLAALAIMAFSVGVAVGGVYADDPVIHSLPGGGWWVASQVMNVSDMYTATVMFKPVRGLGVTDTLSAEPLSLSIDPGASETLMPGEQFGNLAMDEGFKGSAVVASDQPILGIGSIANNPIGDIGISDGRAAAQYAAVASSAVDTRLAFPVVKNDYKGKSTTFYVQTVRAGTVYATYSMNLGKDVYTTSVTTNLDGQMATFSPDDVAKIPITCKPPDFTCLGAVVFTSTVQMAGMYVEHNTAESPAQVLLSTRGFTPRDFDTTIMVPVVKSMWKGRTTGIQIINVGSTHSTITFTLAYQDGVVDPGAAGVVTYTNVAPGSSDTFFPGNHGIFKGPLPPDGSPIDDEFVGAATITSDQPMAVIVNENDFDAPERTKQTTFAAFTQKSATSAVLFPLVKEDFKGNQTGLQIANVGNNPVMLKAEYALNTGTFEVDENAEAVSIVVQPGESFTFYAVTHPDWWSGAYTDYAGGVGAATVRATPVGGGDARIVGIAQEAELPPGGGRDYLDTKNYEGFNQ
jgi:hypothetical protein